MAARAEFTKKYASGYARADKKTKGLILDEVVAVTDWSRDNARRRLTAAKATGLARRRPGPPRGARYYSYDALKVLQTVWSTSGGMCGRYLAAAMPDVLANLEAHGRLAAGVDRYSLAVRAELLAMSPATIDRYLAPAKTRDPIRGKSTTKPGSMLRTSISIRRAGDEVDHEPGWFEADTVAHCGPSLAGEFTRTVNLTDILTGWVHTVSIRNNARAHMLAALDDAAARIPYPIQGLDCDNGSEFINHDVVAWAGQRQIFFTRSRPYRKNDQATIESKNNHVVRQYGFYFRYDTAKERELLNQLWRLVDDRLNYFTPTVKPVGWTVDSVGRRKRVYDQPATPLERLIASGILSPTQQQELLAYRDSLDLHHITEQIHAIQQQLIRLAAAKTRRLEQTTTPRLPDPAGIKLAGKKP